MKHVCRETHTQHSAVSACGGPGVPKPQAAFAVTRCPLPACSASLPVLSTSVQREVGHIAAESTRSRLFALFLRNVNAR